MFEGHQVNPIIKYLTRFPFDMESCSDRFWERRHMDVYYLTH